MTHAVSPLSSPSAASDNRGNRQTANVRIKIRQHHRFKTREYVPRILAATWLFLHPEDYNLEFPVYQNELTELILKRAASLGELTICLGQVESANGWFRTLRNLNPRLSPGERAEAGATITIPKLLVPYYEERCVGGDLGACAVYCW